MDINNFINPYTAWWLELVIAVLLIVIIVAIFKAITWLKRIERNQHKDGVKYPDDQHDETYFRRQGIPIQGEKQ